LQTSEALKPGILVRVLLWAPPLLYMTFIFLESAQSDPLPALTALVWDKALHAVGYAALGALLARAFAGERWSWGRAALCAVIVASAYGASDEFHQSFVVGRDADVYDWIADSIGAAFGAAAFISFLGIWHGHLLPRWPGLARLRLIVGA
jgi:hypothetical protein